MRTRPNQARRGGSTKMGKKFLQEKPGTVWHLSPRMSARIMEGFLMLYRTDDLYCLAPSELRALYTRLWYWEKAGKLRRIKP